MKKLLLILSLAFIPLFGVSPSSADEWNLYTGCNDISSLAQEGGYLWWTGYAGIVRYNRLDGTHRVYTLKDFGEGRGFIASAVAPDGAKWFADDKEVLRLDPSGWTVYKGCGGTVITFDRAGRAWFGTDCGAACFDGYTWKRYGEAEGFTDAKVFSAASDRSGNLWFGTSGAGVFRFDGAEWTKYPASKGGLPSDTVKALARDAEGTLWAGTKKGLATFDGVAWNALPPLGDSDHPLENAVTALAFDGAGGVWVGTEVNLIHLRGEKKTVYDSGNSTLAGAPDPRVHALLVDSDGVLWVASGKPNGPYVPHPGLARFDGGAWSRVQLPGPSGNITSSAAVGMDNRKWFATGSGLTGNPLVSFDGTEWKRYTGPDGLAAIRVNSIAADDAGGMWFCTEKGVSRFDGKTWTDYTPGNGFPGNQALKGAVDHAGVGWFALDTGLYSFDGATWTAWGDSVITHGDLTGDGVVDIICIAVDRDNVKWFGTTHDGILSYDGRVWSHYTKEDGLSGNGVRCITADRDNLIWIGTGILGYDCGVSSFDGKTWTARPYDKSGMWGNITGIAVDEANRKWLVTDARSAVFSFDGAAWKTHSAPWDVGYGGYNCIAIDRDGTKWLGSKTLGVATFRESGGTETAVGAADARPKGFALLGNRPNPFNPSTTIEYTLSAPSTVKLEVYSVTGQKVATLVDGRMGAGTHAAVFDGANCASGAYFYRFESASGSRCGKMLLMR